jgi:NAD-dependent SIR2 family protein deacetylase
LAEQKEHGAFVVTSNVDGQFQKAGFSAQRICEVHGSIHRLQCMDGACSVWAADAFQPKVDESSCRLISDLPHCPQCGSVARPNILMFSDWGWNEQSTVMQRKRLEAWLAGVGRLVTIEIGAGKDIPTIRSMGERMEGKLIRINPKDYWMKPGKGVSIAMGGLDTLNHIKSAI